MEIPTDLASGFQDPKPVSTPSPSLAPQAMPTPQSNVEELAQYGLLDIQRQIAERKRIEASRFQQAIAGDPNMEARKVQIAQELGIDPADPTQDWKIAEQFARQREVERQAFDEKYPLVAAQMRNFDFVAQAYDDIGHLQQIEKIGNFTKGRYMVERGYIGAQLASGIGDARLLRDRLAQIDSSINAVPPLEGVWDSITGGTAEMIGQMSKTMPAAVAAGAAMAAPGLVAGPAAPISSGTLFTAGFLGAQGAQTAIIEGGNAYLDYIQAGMGEAEAKQAASVVGIVNGALETVLGKYALKPFTAAAAKVGPRLAPKVFKPIGKETVAAGFAKSYFAGLGGEIATEIGQEISQIVGEEWGMSVSRPELEQRISTPEGRQQIYDQIGEIASKTFYSMLVLGLPGPLANMAADARRVEQAQTDTAIIKAIATGAQDSKLAERNPELARQFSAEAKGVEEVFITADALRSLLNGIDEQATAEGKVQKSAIDMLRELLPDVVRQLEDATTDKDSIVIKTEDLQVSLRNTEMQSKMLPHLRIDKNGMSEAEAQKYEPNLKAMAQSAKQAISEKAQKDQQFREQLRAIRENQTAQIQAAGRSLSEARIGGHLYAQVMALMNAEVNAKLAAQGKEPIALADFERVYGMSTRAGVPMSENAIEASRVLGKFEVKPVVQTPQEAAQAAPPTAPAQPAEAAVAPAPEAAVPPSQEAAPQAQPQQAPADPVTQAKELLASPPQEMTEQERGVLETFVKDSDQGLRSRLPGTVAQMDAEYLAAVERGDMETAQRMVDEAAKTAGFNRKAFHGSASKPFWVFDPAKRGQRTGANSALLGFFASSQRQVAEEYQLTESERKNYNQPTALVFGLEAAEENLSRKEDIATSAVFDDEQNGWLAQLTEYDQWGAEFSYDNDFVYESESEAIDAAEEYKNSEIAKAQQVVAKKLEQYESEARQLKASRTLHDLWVNLQNPLIYDFQGGTYKDKSYSELVQEAIDEGHDGVVMRNTVDSIDTQTASDVIVFFQSSQAKLADPVTRDAAGNVIPLSQRFDLTKDSILYSQTDQGVGGTYDRMARQTVLNQNAQPTTYFHELMHFMFDSYATLIQQGLASDQMRKDMDTLTRDLGKLEGGFDEYAQLSPERQAQVHEAVAYSWEAWLFSGEVPREDMRPIFSRITEFFVSTWKTLTAINETYKIESGGKDLPGMTPEVKEVFKRMVAARDQIRMAEATKAAVPLFLSKEQWVQYGGNADDWENYQQIERLRIEEAVASLGRKSLRSLGWLTRNHHDRLNAIRKIAENIRAGMYEEVQQEVERTRVERVRRFLATGEMMAEDGSISAEKAKNHKLSIDSVALDREKATAIMQPLDDAVAAAEAEQKLWEDMLLQELPLEPVKPAKPKPLPPAGTTERAVYNEAVEEHRKAMVAYAKEKSRIKSWNQKIRENREASSKAVTEAKRNQRGGLEQIAAMKKKARDAHPLASMLAEDGVSPHFLRDMFGYESAEAVLEDLLKAPSKEDAIMASIDAKMLAENSELSNPQQVEEAVNASLVNQFNTKWLVMELSALERATLGGQNTPAQMQEQQEAEREVIDLKNDLSVAEQTLRAARESKDQSAIERAQESVNDLRAAIRDRQKVAEGKLPPRIMLAAARAAARMATQDKKISELRPDLHVGAARRHSREALQHLTDNDLPAALNSKRQQLLSDQMAREAEDVRAEVQSSRRWFARILKNKNRKDRSLDYVVAARAVLALFGVGSKAQVRRAAETAQQFLQQLQQYEPERFAEINRIIVEATANRKDFRDLTVEEFRRLKALVSELWQYAKDEKSVLLDGTRQQVEAIKTQIQERASKLAKPGARPGQLRKMTPLEGGIAWLRSRIAWMRRAESMFDEWDGKEPGIFTKTFWRPVQKAVLAYRSKRDQYHKQFNDILDKVRPSMKWEPIHSKELNYTFSDTAELMGFLMHLGNESNAAKHIAAGRGAGHQWGTVNEATGAVDETRVWKAINDLIAEGKLTQEHVDAVQEVWNLTADLKPQIQKVYRQKWGEFFHEVPARSFTLTFNDGTTKTYAGGYVPAKVDNDLVADYGDPSSLASVDQEFKDSMPTTGWGFTIKRYEEYRKPLDMDLSRIAQHIEHTMRFVEIQPQLWALSRLLKNEEIKTAINSIDPDALKQVIFPWLSRVASQRTGVRGGDSATDRLLRLTRNRAGMMVMFGNISNTLQQITGVFPALLKVKKSYLFASARRFLSSKKGEFAAWVASKSVFMDQRLRSQIFVLQEHMNDILVNPSKLDKARQFATKNAYIFQATVQNRLDVIIWSAAYEQAMAEKPSGTSELDWEKEAVARADAAVNLTQGSTQPEAISAAESGTEFVRLFTQFTSYFNMLFNLNRAEVKKLTQDGGWSSNKWPLFYTFMMGYAVPSVTAAIIAQAIGGKLDDEDDDGYMDEAGIIMLKGLVSGGLSMVPIAGQSIAALTINRFDEVTYNDRMLSNPAIGAIEKAFGGGYQLLDAAVSEDKDATGRKVRDALILFDMIAGIPVSQTFSKLAMGVNVLTGEQPTYGAVDAARAFVTGTPAEGLRQR